MLLDTILPILEPETDMIASLPKSVSKVVDNPGSLVNLFPLFLIEIDSTGPYAFLEFVE